MKIKTMSELIHIYLKFLNKCRPFFELCKILNLRPSPNQKEQRGCKEVYSILHSVLKNLFERTNIIKSRLICHNRRYHLSLINIIHLRTLEFRIFLFLMYVLYYYYIMQSWQQPARAESDELPSMATAAR
jgi:hypothetical protein